MIALAFRMENSAQSEWCWAAVAVSVSKFYNKAVATTQCGLVENVLPNVTACCSNPSACNKRWYLDRALKSNGNLDRFTTTAEPFSTVERELKAGRVLPIRIGWHPEGGHFVVISGSDNLLNSELLTVQDPNPAVGNSIIPRSELVNKYLGSGSWTDSFFTKP